MAIQVDLIPFIAGDPWMHANLEDGIVLADAALRQELATAHPDTWKRIVARRQFMTGVLGIKLSEDVLPLCDRQAAFAPAALSPNLILTVKNVD